MAADQYDHLFLCDKDSDVTLVIGDYEIPAHRFILSKRSEYFKAMFSSIFRDAGSEKIVLYETNLNAFKRVLDYIYTGKTFAQYNRWYSTRCEDTTSISFEQMFEILTCAQYYMVDEFIKCIVSILKNRGRDAPFSLLNNALAYSFDELILYATDLILEKVSDNLNERFFENLSPLAVKHLLTQRLDTLEPDIFKALVWWMRRNSVHSHAFPQLLELVELHLLDETQLDILFQPTPLIQRDSYKTLLTEQREPALKVQKSHQ
uniref:BTB domain-containing protein n=1 Tax=Panagrellus redivivus TaxID=6233 RepID=A0A7E4W8D5_PANRE